MPDLLVRDGDQVHTRRGRNHFCLSQLSDGEQSVIGLASRDIMAGMPKDTREFNTAPGIVLLDEIGAQLHPRWRMRIVQDLRNAFPKIQFLVTTHEPLCLRGIEADETILMQKEDDYVCAVTDLPSPKGLRVDQLLTSRLFGLYSTIDPETEAEFQSDYTHYWLNATSTPSSSHAKQN